MNRKEGTFRGYDNTELFFQLWEFPNSRGSVIVSHGLAEHTECYSRLAEGLGEFGWNTYAWDMRGHGRSEGKRGAVKNFEEYCHDLNRFVLYVKENLNPKNPLFILGHSMGGLVTARTLVDYGDMCLTAACFSSPLFGIALPVPPIKDMAARFLNRWVPSLTLNNEIKYEELTHDEKISSSYESDPLRHDRISLALYLGMIESMNYVLMNPSKIKLPVFIQAAGKDRVTSTKATERFYERIASTRKDLKVYKDMFHEIFNEVDRKKVYADLNQFLGSLAEGKNEAN